MAFIKSNKWHQSVIKIDSTTGKTALATAITAATARTHKTACTDLAAGTGT